MSPPSFQQIEAKIRQLIEKYEQLKVENEGLRKDMQILEASMQEKMLQQDALEQQIQVLQAARTEEEQRKSAFRKEIDHHLREMNHCIEKWAQS